MLYAFILGRVYTLSLAELLAVLENEKISFALKTVASEIALIETEGEIDAKKLQSKLGGTIKIVKIIHSLNRKKTDYPSRMMQEYLDFDVLKNDYLAGHEGKVQIGVSIYQMDPETRVHFSEPKNIAMLIKRFLQSHDISVRFSMPEPPSTYLPSVVVTHNNLLEKGAEFVLLMGRQNLSIGKTVSVQDFEDYGRRDYQRPFRDPNMGMLPPKIAQIMLNLAKISRGQTVLDPFMGGGTILQEAILHGLSGIGSDIDQKAVDGAETNLNWFRNRYHVPPGRFEIYRLDATKDLVEELKDREINGVVTEGWLGPNYAKVPDKEAMLKNFQQILEVYAKALEQLKKLLKPGSRIVISFPAYRLGPDRYIFFPAIDFIEKLGYSILAPITPEIREKYIFLKVTDRNSMVYDRKDQVVAREIFIIQN